MRLTHIALALIALATSTARASDTTQPELDACQIETKALARVNSRITMATIDAYLDPGKREPIGRLSASSRIEVATENANIQSKHNVIMQALLAEKATATAALTLCKNPPKIQSATIDPLDQIRKLKGLLDDKIITQEEFDTKKAALLK